MVTRSRPDTDVPSEVPAASETVTVATQVTPTAVSATADDDAVDAAVAKASVRWAELLRRLGE